MFQVREPSKKKRTRGNKDDFMLASEQGDTRLYLRRKANHDTLATQMAMSRKKLSCNIISFGARLLSTCTVVVCRHTRHLNSSSRWSAASNSWHVPDIGLIISGLLKSTPAFTMILGCTLSMPWPPLAKGQLKLYNIQSSYICHVSSYEYIYIYIYIIIIILLLYYYYIIIIIVIIIIQRKFRGRNFRVTDF